MLELLAGIFVCIAIGKIANADNRNGFMWGMLTVALCILCMSIPMPFLRFLLAGIIAFVLMMLEPMIRKR